MQLNSLPPSSRSLPRWGDFFLRDKVSQMRENSSNWFSCQMHINLPLSQNIIITIIWIISTPPSARLLGSCSLGHLCDQSLTQPTWDVGPTAWKWDYDCFQLARSFVSVWAFFLFCFFSCSSTSLLVRRNLPSRRSTEWDMRSEMMSCCWLSGGSEMVVDFPPSTRVCLCVWVLLFGKRGGRETEARNCMLVRKLGQKVHDGNGEWEFGFVPLIRSVRNR